MLEQSIINTIRLLSIDQIEKANSGHPGLPMGAAPMVYALWARQMNHNPANPQWINRDRFVLSAGHGSALLYSLLHLFGYGLTIEDLQQFRQWESRTPGHPEFGFTMGVEATTGPLGQGIANGVGMAMSEAFLAATFNREIPIIDHFTYVLCSDGDLMEGISSEACSLAGHLKLGKLVVLYDSNDISLDGDLKLTFSENVEQRFMSYGWQVLTVEDGNDTAAIERMIEMAKLEQDKPTLIEVRTVIGYGSPNRAGTSEAHGKPLGAEERLQVTKSYTWEYEKDFHVPDDVQEYFSDLKSTLQIKEQVWNENFFQYQQQHPQLAKSLLSAFAGELPENWEQNLPSYQPNDNAKATRVVSGETIQGLAKNISTFLGGSADLASSNNTLIKGEQNFLFQNYAGRNIWFGVREHGMGGILNGMLLHGGVRVYGGTFLVFSDYLRPAIRLAALSKLPVIYVFTHDSIAVGEDGPTHEPVEHITSLRLIPGLRVIRPADGNETRAAWEYSLSQSEHPVALILTRQNLPHLPGTVGIDRETISRGAYIISEAAGVMDGIIIATGSEVSLAVKTQSKLASADIHVRVVSMPCREQFDLQPEEYRNEILPPEVKARLIIEAAHPSGWDKYAGMDGKIMGINRFGASAPGPLVMEKYGFNLDEAVMQMKVLTSK